MLKKTEERQVIKIGSNSIIEYGEKGIMRTRIALLNMIASYVNTSQKYGTKTAIVSSGAVACGRMICAERSINHDEVGKQVLASIGNVELNRLWQIAFSYHNITTAQILLNSTGDNGNYQEHIAELFSLGIVPIINENDIEPV